MWVETQTLLNIDDATRLARSIMTPGEALWHLAMGDVARDTPRPASWPDLRSGVRGLREKAVAGAQSLRGVKAADVAGGAVALGGLLAIDGARACDFGAHLRAPASLAQVEAIASRVASLRGG